MAAKKEEVPVLESTVQFQETVESAHAERRIDISESVETTATASMKKLTEEEVVEEVEDKATPLLPVQEPVTVSETQIEEQVTTVVTEKKEKKKAKKTVTISDSVEISEIESEYELEELEEDQPTPRSAKIIAPLREPLAVEEVQPEGRLGEVVEKKQKTRKAKVEKAPTVQVFFVHCIFFRFRFLVFICPYGKNCGLPTLKKLQMTYIFFIFRWFNYYNVCYTRKPSPLKVFHSTKPCVLP